MCVPVELHYCSCKHSPAWKLKKGSDAAKKLTTRFHVSTNIVFSMELPDDVLCERIETYPTQPIG